MGHRRRESSPVRLAVALTMFWVLGSGEAAAIDAGARCLASKTAAVGAYSACLLRASARAATKASIFLDPVGCRASLVKKFLKAEARAAGSCVTAGDVAGREMEVLPTLLVLARDLAEMAPGSGLEDAELRKCLKDSLRLAAGYAKCLFAQAASAAKSGAAPDFARCEVRFAKKVAKIRKKQDQCAPPDAEALIQTSLDELEFRMARTLNAEPAASPTPVPTPTPTPAPTATTLPSWSEAGTCVEGNVSAGLWHSCGVDRDSRPICWGIDTGGGGDFGQATSLPLFGNYVSVAAGGHHTCGLRTGGGVACWGRSDFGQTNSSSLQTYTAISAGQYHSCHLRASGQIDCFGAGVSSGEDDGPEHPHYGQSNPPEGVFLQISAGGYHNCAVDGAGELSCWGLNDEGQTSPSPHKDGFTTVAAGHKHTCGLRVDRKIQCWGDDDYGQITDVPEGAFRQVASGAYHVCAIDDDDLVTCWGRNDLEQTAPPPDRFASLDGGFFHNCGRLTDGRVRCWGAGTAADPDDSVPHYGQSDPPAFVSTSFLANSRQVSAGDHHTCLILNDGTLFCVNKDGPHCVKTPGIETAVPLGTFQQLSKIARGPYSTKTCALRTSGTSECWESMDALPDFVQQVATPLIRYEPFSCGLRMDGTVTCLAENQEGIPADVARFLEDPAPGEIFTQVRVTPWAGCGLRPDGTIFCTQPEDLYATFVGSAMAANYLEALRPPIEARYREFDVGQISLFGEDGIPMEEAVLGCGILLQDGSIDCWSGGLEPPAGSFHGITVGAKHACAIRDDDDTVVCWGGAFNDATGCAETPPEGEFVEVSAGFSHTCARPREGEVVCWGCAPTFPVCP